MNIRVQVVYATAVEQSVVELSLPPGATVREALRESGLLERHAHIDIEHAALGVFGERVTPQHVLHDGERVEIYRELLADPKEARRLRARRRSRQLRD